MQKSCIKVSRAELYSELWNTPAQQVARKYGVSDVAIGKICKKYDIPKPPRGYWTRQAAGKKERKVELPAKNLSVFIEIGQQSNIIDRLKVTAEKAAQLPHFPVPEKLTRPDPLVLQTMASFEAERNRTSGYSALGEKDKVPVLPIHVSERLQDRALRILDTLMKALQSLGHSIGPREDAYWDVGARIFGMHVRFKIYELSQIATSKESYFSWQTRSGLALTGRLCFKTDIWCCHNLRHMWRDGKDQKLEDQIKDIVVGLIALATRLKEVEDQKAKEAAERAAIERKQEEERRAYLAARARVEQLRANAAAWHQSRQIREYVEAAKEAEIRKHGVIQTGSDFAHWAEWALQAANTLDPLNDW